MGDFVPHIRDALYLFMPNMLKKWVCDANSNHNNIICALLVIGDALFYAQPWWGRAVFAL